MGLEEVILWYRSGSYNSKVTKSHVRHYVLSKARIYMIVGCGKSFQTRVSAGDCMPAFSVGDSSAASTIDIFRSHREIYT